MFCQCVHHWVFRRWFNVSLGLYNIHRLANAVSQQALHKMVDTWDTDAFYCIFSLSFFFFLAHLSTTCSGWAIVIDHCPPSVRPCVRPSVNNYLKNLLLWNRPTDFNETSQKWSLADALSENFKNLNSMKNSGCHGNRKKKLKKSSCPKP